MNQTPMGWVALAALIVGAVVRLMKQDMLGVALTRLFRPGGPPIAIPTRVLPWLALAFGALAAVLDAVVAGASWDAAAQAGVIAAAGAVFGHELLSGVPGVKKVLGIALLVVPLGASTGCHLLTKERARTALDAMQIACVMSSFVTDEKAVAEACDVADDMLPVLRDLIGQRDAARSVGVRWGDALDDAGAPLDAGVEAQLADWDERFKADADASPGFIYVDAGAP